MGDDAVDEARRWAEISTSPGHLLRLVRQRWGAEWSRRLPDGITTPQFTVLALLAGIDEVDQQTIGSRAGLDKSTLGQLVERLEGAGLVASRVDPASRRRKLVRITASGRSALAEAAVAQREVQERMLAPLSKAEVAELRRLLSLIARDPA